MRVAVTGASGFVGGAIASALADEGFDVTGYGRRGDGWRHERGRYVRSDLVACTGPLADVDVVVNAAATTDEQASVGDAFAINADVPRRLPSLFPGARIVHLSSSSVYDAEGTRRGLREDAPRPRRHLGSYPASKAAGDRAALAAGAVVLRPHAVYGPGDTTLLPRFAALVRDGLLPLPGGARSWHTLTRVESIAEATLLVLAARPASGVYNIADDGSTRLDRVLCEALRYRSGRHTRVVSVPLGVAWAVARAGERARRTGLVERVPLTPYALTQVVSDCTLDTSRARAAFGFVPRHTDVSDAATW
ncbi:NAD-dependent epimerase/dehydratase family protein [Pseudoclavibacter chungangensis]|nr:NAD(P)-dependent oxidoreductase [Pseudoclavibacter chungangensis]